MVYHFEAQKFLHVCIPQHGRGRKGGGAHKARNRELKKKEGLKKDLSPKVEQQKQKSVLERDRKVHLNS